MFHIDPTDPTPIEDQLVRTIRSAVGAGALAPGDALPTVHLEWSREYAERHESEAILKVLRGIASIER